MIPQLLLADPFFFLFGGLGLAFGLFALLLSVFWIWMLIDSLTNAALSGTEKLIWALIIFFTHIIGAVIYFLVARGSRSGPVV